MLLRPERHEFPAESIRLANAHAGARYRSIFDHAAIGIAHTTPDGRILEANRSLCEMLGYGAEELCALTTRTLTHADDRDRHDALRVELLAGLRESFSVEKRYLRKDGSAIWVKRTVTLARDAANEAPYLIQVIEDISGLKQAEAQLSDHQRRFESMFEQAAVGITRVDLNGILVDANQKFCDMLGLSKAELLGRHVRDVTHPDDYGQGAQYRAHVARRRGGSEAGEKRFLRKDGTTLWVRRTMSAARDETGEAQYIISVVEDITERKEAAERYRATFDSAPVGIVHTSLDGRYLQANRRFCAMLGYSEEELVGRSAADFTLFEDRDRGREQRELMWEGKLDEFKEEKRYLRKDGSVLWTIRTVSVARDASGQAMYFIRVIEDITERKGMEERYRATFDNAPVGIMHTAVSDYRILRANRKLSEMLGYTEAELLGMTSTDVVHPDYQFSDKSKYADKLLNGESQSFASERKFVRKDGSEIWVNRTVSLVRDAAGEPEYFIRIVEDITERVLSARRRDMEHAVTAVLTTSPTLAAAMPELIRTICEGLGWTCGLHWQWDGPGQVLRCVEAWHVGADEVAQFVEDSKHSVNEAPAWVDRAPGTATAGLVRSVWLTGAPVWFPDVTRRPGFRRGEIAAKAGLHCAFGFPILASGRPLGVMEFYSRDIKEPDDALLHVVQAMGSQIGQFIQRRQAEEKLLHLAHYDVLTGLPNRVLFYDRLKHAIAQAKRNSWIVGVMFMDVDRFKNINDTLGHDVGDQLLQQVSERLARSVRASDTVGRLGGDEFAIVLSNLSGAEDAGLVAQKIMAKFKQPFRLNGSEIFVSTSIGITHYPNDGTEQEVLLKNADAAMYRAKEAGRNTYQYYTPEMSARALALLTLEGSLRRALKRDEFLLHYQPKACVVSGEITGVEALLRWRHPERGLVSPAEFIPVLEETGLIVQASEWVLNAVCRQLDEWQRAGVKRVPVAVNLSARQFLAPDLGVTIKRILEAHHVAPSLLELEITESSLMVNPQEATRTLEYLKSLGVALSIDDFGTGYSSLSYLKRFPLDALKVDRSFVHDITTDANDATITLAVISMAHSLGLKVIAEGVETAEQLEFLARHGCDQVQGYYLARPLPADECTRSLSERRRLHVAHGAAGSAVAHASPKI